MLLKVGRHIRIKPEYKLIIGREEGKNNYLDGYRNQFACAYCSSHNGPGILIDGELKPEDEEFTAKVLARFTQGRDDEKVTMVFKYLDGTSKEITVQPMPVEEIKKEWYVQ